MFEKYFEPILEKQEEADYVKARERADFFMDNFEFIKEEEIVKIDPKRIKDNVPIFISPGWGVSPNSQKETLEVIADKERRVVTVDFIREQILKDKEDDGLQIAELQKSLAIVQALEKSGLEKVDAIGHSEGGLNLVIAAMLYPEKFRNIVLVAPAGITGKESYLNLIKRFTIDEGMEEMRASANNMNSFYEYFKNLSKYFIKNVSLSKQEIKEMSESDILEMTKVLKQKGVGISVVCGVNDKVFPIENVINRVNASNLDHFISTKGNHGSFIFNKEHALLAENILSNMRRE